LDYLSLTQLILHFSPSAEFESLESIHIAALGLVFILKGKQIYPLVVHDLKLLDNFSIS
jgi:hypothetical protein